MEAIGEVIGRVIDRVGARRRVITDAILADGIGNDPEKSPAAPGGHTAGSLGRNTIPASITADVEADRRTRLGMRDAPAMGKSAIGDLQ
jgi:hypothetical protein